MEKVMVIAAHPDDEILGCGATMAKHVASGDEVHVLIVAEGITSRNPACSRYEYNDALSELAISAKKANDLIGVASLKLLPFPDNQMDTASRLSVTQSIEKHLSHIKPTIIYTHHAGDVNVDHRITCEATVTACRPIPNFCVKKLLFFEVLSSTEWQTPNSFSPNWFINIEAFLEKKIEALHCYNSEMRDWPHPRSYRAVESLARCRGATIGVDAAEAFMLGRYSD